MLTSEEDRQDGPTGVTSQLVLRIVIGLIAVFCFVSCQKQAGDAIVVSKEHIDAAATPIPGETPITKESATSGEEIRPISADEITVDGYVMKPAMRGTSHDPRALKDEQWRVTVRTIAEGRTFAVQVERPQFDNLKEGDRVHIRYRVGKYTGTVWSSEIVR